MNFLKKIDQRIVILITEIAVVFLMIMKVVPPEAGLFLTGLIIFYFIFSSLKDSLWVLIASIPLFTVFPLIEGDSMANWRILIAALFLILYFRKGVSISLIKDKFGKWKFKENLKHYLVEYLVFVFLIIGVFSLFVADDIWSGIKKILFLVNIFLLFLIIRNLARKDKEIVFSIINASKVAIGIVLSIGFIQYISIIFVRLFPFWQFWARNVIPVFYGQDLSNLLSYSNTWFSYYSSLPATLRMFSIFPDSHSFAFFCILSIPFFLTAIFLNSEKKIKKIIPYSLLILSLLAIIFSGSRGAWVAALGSLIIALITFLIFKFKGEKRKQVFLIIGTLIIFFLLFPISSRILLSYQQIQLDRPLEIGDDSFFERARSIFDFDEISVKSRLEIWQKTLYSISQKPLLGVGIGNYPIVLNEDISATKRGSSAHSLYLDVASEMGIIGLIILLAIFIFIIKDTWQVFIHSNQAFLSAWAGFFLLALVWILSYSLFDIVLLNDKVLLFSIVNLAIIYATKASLNHS